MKLFKGLLAIVLIAMIAVSCDSKKKDNPTNETENVAENDKKTVDGEKKTCAKDCTKACCAKKGNHKCDENCKKNGCTAKKECAKDCKKACCAKDHKCSDAKCSADCKVENCKKCATKQAECKTKCAAKKA